MASQGRKAQSCPTPKTSFRSSGTSATSCGTRHHVPRVRDRAHVFALPQNDERDRARVSHPEGLSVGRRHQERWRRTARLLQEATGRPRQQRLRPRAGHLRQRLHVIAPAAPLALRGRQHRRARLVQRQVRRPGRPLRRLTRENFKAPRKASSSPPASTPKTRKTPPPAPAAPSSSSRAPCSLP
jgi:hypothetical protein